MSIYDDLPCIQDTGEILEDKKTDWRNEKLKSLAVAKCFELDFLGRFSKIENCGSVLTFAVDTNEIKRLIHALFCKDRMCPSCQRRRSLVIFHQVQNICKLIEKDFPTYRYVFLTLTIPNCKADELNNKIKLLNASWRKLTQRKFFDKSIKGWFKTIEITYNEKRKDYHPHLHILLCVPSNYFTKNYISRDEWLEYWQKATKDYSITQVDIRAIKPNKKSKDCSISGAAAEVSKYATKPSDYIEKVNDKSYRANKKVVLTLAKAIERKQLVSMGGLMLEYQKKLNQLDVESDEIDLVHVSGESDQIDAIKKVIFTWNVGFKNYIS